MNPDRHSTYRKQGGSHILHDPARLAEMDDAEFLPSSWQARGGLLGGAPGRGTTVFIQDGRGELALRHYRRGGLIGRLVHDCYLWLGLSRSRPWREYALLASLYGMGLPVPRPVAARCERHGLCYRADLITERLSGRTLAAALQDAPLAGDSWQAVGACIRRFHRAGVYHADLNARNILLADDGRVVLLDFDQGRFRRTGKGWQRKNLMRLRRSLDKFRHQQPGFAFDEDCWKMLINGYDGGERVTTA